MFLETKERKWILIVDDEVDMRDSIRELIKLNLGENVVVVEAKDGLDATTKVNFQKFDCILTDLNMPRKEGDAFIYSARMNPLNETTPIVIISGANNIEEVKNLYEFVEILKKPINSEKLIDIVKDSLKLGNNQQRVSADVFNNLVSSVNNFFNELSKVELKQSGEVYIKKKGEEIKCDHVSTIQLKMGKVTNTFSILMNEEDVKELFKESCEKMEKEISILIRSMNHVVLNHVLGKAKGKKASSVKGSFFAQGEEVLREKAGVVVCLEAENSTIRLFATTQ